jgi:hypothetical protein
MSHFSPADWVDFARGLLPQPEAAALQAHLDDKCGECLESVAMWRSVREYLSREAQYGPPDEVFETTAAAYTAVKPWRWLVEAARQAELIFDSFRQPILAFVRGSTSSSRRLVHKAEPFVIDLRLEAVRDRFYLLGQILNSEHPAEEMHGVDILLLSGEDLVAKAKANPSGEFEVQCERGCDLRLFINIRGHRAIGIAIPDDET